MKKIRIIPIMLFTLLCITGCGEKKASIDDLTIYDTVTRREIKIGDSKDKVDKILGTDKKDGLIVGYDDNHKVDRIISYNPYEEKQERYRLKCGISCNSTVTDFVDKYPTAEGWQALPEYRGEGYLHCKRVQIKQAKGKYKYVQNSGEYVISIWYSSYEEIEKIDIMKI